MYLHVYKDATEGGTDGTQCSESSELNAVTTSALDTSINDVSDIVELALRCDATHITFGDTVVTPNGPAGLKWQLSLDGIVWAEYGASITFTEPIAGTNVRFYARAKSIIGEAVINDLSVDLQIVCIVRAV